jgi:chromosome segregation ATPase
MTSGAHIPPYLLCERFADGCRVADLFPVDDRGAALLGESAALVVVVGPAAKGRPVERVARIAARVDGVPLGRAAFDLVLALNPAGAGGPVALEALLGAARTHVTATGLVAAMIPNRETIGIDGAPQRDYPDLIEFERLLRRHFPHVNVFGVQPLYGSVLTPLGRRAGAEPPVFDDRLLPDGGEPPTHFLALCSHRYQRLDDTTIAQVPFVELAEGVRGRTEKLESTLKVLRLENDARGREIESLERRLRELEEELARTQFERRNRASLTAEVTRLEEAVRRRDELLAEAQEALDAERRGAGAKSEELLDAKLRLRQIEQRLADAERAADHAARERDEAETARLRLQALVADASNESKTHQRELDDRMEAIAGLEVEVGNLRAEAARLKQELLAARESSRRAAADRSDIDEANARADAATQQLNRALDEAAGERERLDRRLEEIRLQLGAETAVRDQLERERVLLTQRNEELSALRDRELASARQAAAAARSAQERGEQGAAHLRGELERASARVEELEARLVTAGRERGTAASRIERQEMALAELRRVVAEQSDEAGRRAHLVESLTARAATAEADAAANRESCRELHAALCAAEAEIAELRARVAQGQSTAAERDAALRDVADLRAEVSRIRPDANAAASARLRADTAETALLERDNAIRTLQLELAAAREQLATATSTLLERDGVIRGLEDALVEARHRATTAETALTDREAATHGLELELSDTRERAQVQNKDLAAALEALAVTEETVEARMQTAADRIRAMKAENRRLKEENETELLKVREDLETELRTTSALLEKRDGEIWELKEEVLRLHAQVVATVAAQAAEGRETEFQQSLADQENQIFALGEERDRLRNDNERLTRSVTRAKKNVRILVALLMKERAHRLAILADGAAPAEDAGSSALTLSDEDLDLFAELGDSTEAERLLDAAVARLDPRRASAAPDPETAAEVDSVMESVRVAAPQEDEEQTTQSRARPDRSRDPT